ncbi:hypothetical protein D3C85_1251010 [compost metagenome]
MKHVTETAGATQSDFTLEYRTQQGIRVQMPLHERLRVTGTRQNAGDFGALCIVTDVHQAQVVQVPVEFFGQGPDLRLIPDQHRLDKPFIASPPGTAQAQQIDRIDHRRDHARQGLGPIKQERRAFPWNSAQHAWIPCCSR